MDMAHSTSGRAGYDPLRLTDAQRADIKLLFDQNILSNDIILQMLRRENEVRLSDEFQACYRKQRGDVMGYANVTTLVQMKVYRSVLLNAEFNSDVLGCLTGCAGIRVSINRNCSK